MRRPLTFWLRRIDGDKPGHARVIVLGNWYHYCDIPGGAWYSLTDRADSPSAYLDGMPGSMARITRDRAVLLGGQRIWLQIADDRLRRRIFTKRWAALLFNALFGWIRKPVVDLQIDDGPTVPELPPEKLGVKYGY